MDNSEGATLGHEQHLGVFLAVFNTTDQAVAAFWARWHGSSDSGPVIGNLSVWWNESSDYPSYTSMFQQGNSVSIINGWYPSFQGGNSMWISAQTIQAALIQSEKLSNFA